MATIKTTNLISEYIDNLDGNITEMEFISGEHVIHFNTQTVSAHYYNTRKPQEEIHIDYKGTVEIIFEGTEEELLDTVTVPTWVNIFDREGNIIITMVPSGIVTLNKNYFYFKRLEEEEKTNDNR